MSARNFYQAFYQNDQLFRLANEPWQADTSQPTVVLPVDEPVEAESAPVAKVDLLSELDTVLATLPGNKLADEFVDKTPLVEQPIIQPEEPIIAMAPAEPLPQTPPRPTVPPVVPAIQQPRTPQLNHKVLLLADEELDPSNILFLEKILKAINLNIAGVDLLNLHGAGDLNFAELVADKKIHHFITFGVPFSRIHLDIAMDRYQPIRFFGITFLMADSLPTIEADQNLKKRLWGALQRIFLQS